MLRRQKVLRGSNYERLHETGAPIVIFGVILENVWSILEPPAVKWPREPPQYTQKIHPNTLWRSPIDLAKNLGKSCARRHALPKSLDVNG